MKCTVRIISTFALAAVLSVGCQVVAAEVQGAQGAERQAALPEPWGELLELGISQDQLVAWAVLPMPLAGPYVDGYEDTGCLDEPPDQPEGYCDPDEITLTVEGDALHVLHASASYNCCADEIALSLDVQGNWLTLTEEEILTFPCYCICCYNVETTVANLFPGTYTVEYCWFDYDTWRQECCVAEIQVPR